MIKISKEIANALEDTGQFGIFCSFGAGIGDSEFVIYYEDDDEGMNFPYLAHASEFEIQGLCVRLKQKES